MKDRKECATNPSHLIQWVRIALTGTPFVAIQENVEEKKNFKIKSGKYEKEKQWGKNHVGKNVIINFSSYAYDSVRNGKESGAPTEKLARNFYIDFLSFKGFFLLLEFPDLFSLWFYLLVINKFKE